MIPIAVHENGVYKLGTVHRLAFKKKLSRRESRKRIVALGLLGKHGYRNRLTTADDVFAVLREAGYNRSEIIEDCRQYPRAVPLFANLLGATGHVSSEGAERLKDHVTGKIIYEFEGPGITSSPGYQGLFEFASRARDRAVQETSLPDYHAAIIFGFASIEALLNRFALLWNHRYPEDKVVEGQDHKVRIEAKFDDWIPKFTAGKTFDKSGVEWNDFKILKGVRDDAVHPKLGRIAVRYSDMADHLNRFRTGIASLAIELLKLVDWGAPAAFINARFSPPIRVMEQEEPQ